MLLVNHPSFSTTIMHVCQLMGLASCTRDGGKEKHIGCYMDIEKIVFEELYKHGLLKQ